MYKLLQFIFNHSRTFLFVLLEVICLVVFFTFNNFQGATYFNTSNQLVGSVYAVKREAEDYIELKYQNERLADENAYLRYQLNKRVVIDEQLVLNHLRPATLENIHFVAAKVVNNTNTMVNNYITINKGKKDSLEAGMGVFSPMGAVGVVKKCSENYCLVNSLLHSSIYISSKLKSKDALGSVRWEGDNPTKGLFLYIPRHIEVKKGDTVLTSGQSNTFPEGVHVGYVETIDIKPDETFYRINIRFAADFSRLNYVYVVKSRLKLELDTLQKNNVTEPEAVTSKIINK
jgi:rod shape-determining protein MreC